MKWKRDICAVALLYSVLSLCILGTALGQTTSGNGDVNYDSYVQEANALSERASVSTLTEDQGLVADVPVPQDYVEKRLKKGHSVDYKQYKLATKAKKITWKKVGASTYGIGDGLLGSHCSDGSKVTKKSLGVAHKKLKLGTKLQLKYKNRILNVEVVDRGPFIEGRELDLQPAVAKALGFSGVHEISYRILD